jgi:hypothetical protein
MYDVISHNLFWFLIFPYVALAVYIAVIYLIDKDRNITISQSIGKTRFRSIIFALFIILCSVPVYLTFLFYIGPSKGLSGWYQATIVAMFIGQTMLSSFPHKEDSFKLHKFSSNFWADMAVLSNAIILFFGETTLIEKIFLTQFIISAIIILPIIYYDKLKRWTFAMETFAIVNWAVTLFVLAF